MLRLTHIALSLGLSLIPSTSFACFGNAELSYARFAEPKVVFEGRVESVSPLRFKVYNVVRGELDKSEITVGVMNGGGNRWSPGNYESFVEKYGEVVRMRVSLGSMSCGSNCVTDYYLKAICASPYILPVDSTRDDPGGDITQIYGQRLDYWKRFSAVEVELKKLFPTIIAENLRKTPALREELLTAAMLLGNVKPPADSELFRIVLTRDLTSVELASLMNGRPMASPTALRYDTIGFYAFIEDVLIRFERSAYERYLERNPQLPAHSKPRSKAHSNVELIPPYTVKSSGEIVNGKGDVIGRVNVYGEFETLEGKVIGRVAKAEK